MAQLEEKFRILKKAELVEKSEKQGSECPDYSLAISLYYKARYFVAVFEARNHELPIQVWNEFRNALDHFMRHLTDKREYTAKEGTQKKAMEKHLLRASLDIMKIICVYDSNWIDSTLSQFNSQALALVDNGDFFKSITSEKIKCSRKLEHAKTSDSGFGNTENGDAEILNNYTRATWKCVF